MGGTRFIGRPLVQILSEQNHELTLFTRGYNEVPKEVDHILGDRKNLEDLKSLSKRKFDLIIDTSGRTLADTESLIRQTGVPNVRYIYISSAGVYKKSNILPVDEKYFIDEQSRHIGKAFTERWLTDNGIPYTSFRPTYIYGPGNYNPIERWFFDRIIYRKPIPIPGDGETITQLGHVFDLAKAISKSVESDIAKNKIYNCSGKKAITFKGLIEIAAVAANVDPGNVDTISFDPSKVDSKARKAFPLRLENFYTDISLCENELCWSETFDLKQGFKDSFENDYLLNKSESPDFTSDKNLY
tara:strand:+ start:1594 stop:2493 length:900 start_codon:yes stop_codon:yes gene_type:complete